MDPVRARQRLLRRRRCDRADPGGPAHAVSRRRLLSRRLSVACGRPAAARDCRRRPNESRGAHGRSDRHRRICDRAVGRCDGTRDAEQRQQPRAPDRLGPLSRNGHRVARRLCRLLRVARMADGVVPLSPRRRRCTLRRRRDQRSRRLHVLGWQRRRRDVDAVVCPLRRGGAASVDARALRPAPHPDAARQRVADGAARGRAAHGARRPARAAPSRQAARRHRGDRARGSRLGARRRPPDRDPPRARADSPARANGAIPCGGRAVAARGAERAAGRGGQAEGRVRRAHLARPAHAAHVDHRVRRADARRGGRAAARRGAPELSAGRRTQLGAAAPARRRPAVRRPAAVGQARARPRRWISPRSRRRQSRTPSHARSRKVSRSPMSADATCRSRRTRVACSSCSTISISNAIKFTPEGGHDRRSSVNPHGRRLRTRGGRQRHRAFACRRRARIRSLLPCGACDEQADAGHGSRPLHRPRDRESHGGRIVASSTLEAGTTFRIELAGTSLDRRTRETPTELVA